MSNVIQFMHPGDEYKVTNPGFQNWNMSGKHFRRLLRHQGWYVDSSNVLRSGDLAFWNEYEAPTRATPITRQGLNWVFAKYYHSIVSPISPLTGNLRARCARNSCCLNTDPCVFGDTFKYSNCQQKRNGDLWMLPPNSIILFGSYKKLQAGASKRPYVQMFALDTVFVTEPGVVYTVPVIHGLPFQVSQEYQDVTLRNLYPVGGQNQFVFYRGRTPVSAYKDEINVNGEGIYSFTPARVFGNRQYPYNARCLLNLHNLNQFLYSNGINVSRRGFSPKLMQKHKCVIYSGRPRDLKLLWDEVRRIVQSVNHFELGVHFDWPKAQAAVGVV